MFKVMYCVHCTINQNEIRQRKGAGKVNKLTAETILLTAQIYLYKYK